MERKDELEQFLKYQSVQDWFESVRLSNQANNKTFTLRDFGGRLRVLEDFVEFTKMNPDQLLEEGREDLKKSHARLMGFFSWLLSFLLILHSLSFLS